MPLPQYLSRLLSILVSVGRWKSLLDRLDRTRRLRIARYADDIASTLGRAALWAEAIERDRSDEKAVRALFREMGRLQGYLETLFDVLSDHLDGRKLGGVKRRLYALSLRLESAPVLSSGPAASARINQLVAAEGYFRALADGLRV